MLHVVAGASCDDSAVRDATATTGSLSSEARSASSGGGSPSCAPSSTRTNPKTGTAREASAIFLERQKSRVQTAPRVWNWAKTRLIQPRAFMRPATLDELRALLRAATQNRRVRAMGSVYSFSGCVDAEDIWLDLTKLKDKQVHLPKSPLLAP